MKFIIAIVITLSFSLFAQSGDTITTKSGLKYIVINKGTGIHAEINKSVQVHYIGSFTDGKVFDSSRERGNPIEFILGTGRVIQGWEEGIALMNVGDRYKLIIPSNLGYGKNGSGYIPPDATLIFDVELINVSTPIIEISDALVEYIIADSIQIAVNKYHELKNNHYDEYNFKDSLLRYVGYQLLNGGRTNQAIELFKLNAESFPEMADSYNCLGEAYLKKGDKEEAKIYYKKSLKINPSDKTALDNLKKLQDPK